MKHILNFLKAIVIGAWIIIAVATTVCLISYNQYKISEFGKYSLVIIDNEELQPTYNDHDLVIVKKGAQNTYKVGDYVFFYSGNKTEENFVNFAQITEVEKDDVAESSYYFGETKVSYSDVIGAGNGSMVYHKVGLVLSILESRWGYMFLVILPTLFAFVFEIYAIVSEVKTEAKKELDKE